MAIPANPHQTILAVDIGGTGLKAALIDGSGRMLTERVRVKTPQPATPRAVLAALGELVQPLEASGAPTAVSVGFPGVVRRGVVITAPNLGTERWRGFELPRMLGKTWKKPVRVINDADMQGLGAASGRGVEVVVTLGTGFGSALLEDGRLVPHLEIAHHPFRKGETYEQQVGNVARKKIGDQRWSKRVERAIETLRDLIRFDRLYIGGGNARHLQMDLPSDVRIVSNDCGMRGGAALWRSDFDDP